MKKIVYLLAIAGMFFFSQDLYSQDLKGQWQNQLGSTLTITDFDEQSGFIKGDYISPTATKGEKYDLVGWVNSKPIEEGKNQVTVLTFSVRWGAYGSITSWTGYYELVDGVPRITTMWHLARPVTGYIFEHVITGSDIFLPLSKN